MEYLLLIYGSEAQESKASEAEMGKMIEEYGEFTKNIVKSGHMKGGNRLYETTKATTVRVRGGKRAITDGPFAETKEQLGGYYLIQAKDLDEAVGIAARIPSVRFGSIEVRPVYPMQMPG